MATLTTLDAFLRALHTRKHFLTPYRPPFLFATISTIATAAFFRRPAAFCCSLVVRVVSPQRGLSQTGAAVESRVQIPFSFGRFQVERPIAVCADRRTMPPPICRG